MNSMPGPFFDFYFLKQQAIRKNHASPLQMLPLFRKKYIVITNPWYFQPRMEQLAVRFKTQELATQFKEVFEDCQEKLQNPPASSAGKPPPLTEEKKTDSSKTKDSSSGKQPSLGSMFKPKAGSWECQVSANFKTFKQFIMEFINGNWFTTGNQTIYPRSYANEPRFGACALPFSSQVRPYSQGISWCNIATKSALTKERHRLLSEVHFHSFEDTLICLLEVACAIARFCSGPVGPPFFYRL